MKYENEFNLLEIMKKLVQIIKLLQKEIIYFTGSITLYRLAGNSPIIF